MDYAFLSNQPEMSNAKKKFVGIFLSDEWMVALDRCSHFFADLK
jgi:hypothetical protein